jgi:hypothetical protein
MAPNPCSTGFSTSTRLSLVTVAAVAVLGSVLLADRADRPTSSALSEKAIAGYQTTDQLLLTVGLANPEGRELRGTLRVEVVGPSDTALAQAEQEVRQTERAANYRFELHPGKLAPAQVTLRCSFGQQTLQVPLSKLLVVKAHETSLTSSQEFYAGSPAAIHCNVHGVKSITETVPLAGADVTVRLNAKDGQVYLLAIGKTATDGTADPSFKVPEVSAGQYTLEVATQSAFGQEKLERKVQVKSGAKVLLITDKPLYQPGQVLHIRALALRPFDLKPVGSAELTFEVEDAKGNKVFKRAHRTSDFGVASVDFQLADEVNMGDYHVRAILGEHQADKTVTVKRYVLPKFKTELTADKRFYLPRETVHADLQTDYFFGKPVADAKVKVTASTFDVQFREFQTWEGRTDGAGHAKFEIKLPDYFVGQPLQKGDALVRMEAKVTDTADHTETLSRSYTVSDQPIKVSLIPEGGRLVPGIANRIFVAALYPDGGPAVCDVKLWLGRVAKDKPLATVKTNEAGLAEFTLTPKAEQFRQGQWEQRQVEMLGRPTVTTMVPKMLLDLYAEARDGKGNSAGKATEVGSDPFGDNVLLRLDKAIYQGGDTLQVEVRSSAGLPTAYLDLVKGGQTLLTRWLEVKDGKADYKLDLPAELFGTLEVRAYQMLNSGEIVRDSRVVYVSPRDKLKIDVKPDKSVYLPGESGRIRFQVTDAAGKPTAAALGVLVVDEAVYALQEMQPGLEKVYFTLQEELLKPKTEVLYRPHESIDNLVREPELPADKQQVAQVLLTAVRPPLPTRWQVTPEVERRQQAEAQVQQLGWALQNYASNSNRPFLKYDKAAKRWIFRPGLLNELAQAGYLPQRANLKDPFGNEWTIEKAAQLDKNFTPERLAHAATLNHMQQVYWMFINYTNANQAKWFKNGKWELPDSVLGDSLRNAIPESFLKDAWGGTIKLVKRPKKLDHQTGLTQLDYYELTSAGPDGKFGTDDDVKLLPAQVWNGLGAWWLEGNEYTFGFQPNWRVARRGIFMDGAFARNGAMPMGAMAGMGGGGGPMPPMAAPAAMKRARALQPLLAEKADAAGTGQAGAAAPPTRVREYFPETLLWQPALITDDQGVADLPVPFADSITTWRLTASASGRAGALGGVSAPLRVFQDFFVDIDLPVSLTQNDEVAFPVAVYNYLKTPQTVKLDLQREAWFDLADDAGFTRSLDLQPGQVTAVKFRIRAHRIGFQPLTVKATGSKMSDAVKRTVEVVPDGSRVEKVFTDRLTGKVTQTIEIPENAIPDASKILVKIYPGVFSQVMEGTEGMLRMPFG